MTVECAQVQQAIGLFKSKFKNLADSQLFYGRAPGRLEILGNHTDYNEGFILSAAIDKFTIFVGTVTGTTEISLYSDHMDSMVTFDLYDNNPYPKKSKEFWANYPRGVIQKLSPSSGFCGVIASNVPVGAGVSSSAAIDLATAMFLRSAFPASLAGTLSMVDLAIACKKADNDFVGIGCGILDQFSSAMGKTGKLISLDCRNLHNFSYTELPKNYKFVVVMSEAPHQLVDGKYDQLRKECFEAAAAMGREFLRDVSPEEFEEKKPSLPENLRKKASHIIGENKRVLEAVDILSIGKAIQLFGNLMNESHASSRDDFGNSCPELDMLVQLSTRLPGCIGSRLQGGGFGGSTIHLVDADMVDMFQDLLLRAYFEKTGISTSSFVVAPGDGATGGPIVNEM